MASDLTRVSVLFFIFSALILAVPAFGQKADRPLPSAEQVDAYIANGMAQLDAPGAAVALFENGEITHLKGFGRIDGTGTRVTPQTPFQIASMTKSFTSLIVLQLADQGRLSIDDPVVRHIPYFRTSDPDVSAAITVRQLMNHRSGISTLDGNRYQRTTYRGQDALERAVKRLAYIRLETTPGDRFHYSNANYAILADLIEVIEQASLEEVMETRIFSKIGMANTYMQVANRPVEPEAKGHLQYFGIPIQDHFVAGRMMMGAGGVTTSAEDLAKYMLAITENDPRIVPAALAESWTQQGGLPYEFGWEHHAFGGQPVLFHNGQNPGFSSIMMYTPESGRGGLFLMNMSGTLQGNLPDGTIRYALGLPSMSIAPAGLFPVLLWGSLGLMAFLAIACVVSIARLRTNASKPWCRSKLARWTLIVVPSLCLIAFAFILLVYVPHSFGVNFAAASLFNPDLGLLHLASAIIALAWAGTRSVFLIQRCRIE